MRLHSNDVNNHENIRFRNSVRPDLAAPGPRKLRVVFPVISVLSKPPQLPYGAKYCFWGGGVGWAGLILTMLVGCRKLLQPEAPSFRGDPTDNLEVLCHEATFQECQTL